MFAMGNSWTLPLSVESCRRAQDQMIRCWCKAHFIELDTNLQRHQYQKDDLCLLLFRHHFRQAGTQPLHSLVDDIDDIHSSEQHFSTNLEKAVKPPIEVLNGTPHMVTLAV